MVWRVEAAAAIPEPPNPPQILRREQGELRWVSVWVTCCVDFGDTTTILEVLAPLCTGLAQGLEIDTQRRKRTYPFGNPFSHDSLILDVLKLDALGCAKGAQKMFLGCHFDAIPR